MTRSGTALPPRAARGEVSAQRTEGSWGGVSIESSIHLDSLQCLVDRFEYDLGPDQHVVVPEVVVGLLSMLTSVQLDDDGSLKASEVADIRPNRMLSAEFESCQLASAQTLPKHAFRMGRVFAKRAGESKHPLTEPRVAGISMAAHNFYEQRLMTPPALRATSPASLGREAVVR